MLYCCEPQGCCGCLDRGLCYTYRHVCCLPCTFGRLAQVGAGHGYCGCCVGFGVGIACGAYVTGHAVLPCAVSVRRALVAKYALPESWCVSFLHIWCCPVVSILQMAMEVEEREGGIIEPWGAWRTQNDMLTPIAPPMERS